MAEKEIKVPFPAQWTILLATMLGNESGKHDLPFKWSAAMMGGVAMQWERPQALLTVRKQNPTFTLIAMNDGQILFMSERNGFGNTDGFYHHENELADIVETVIETLKKYL